MPYPRNIVLIDDDHDDHEIFKMALQSIGTGITCTYYDDARKALEVLSGSDQQPPDYIFLDLNMPAINGKECLKMLKESELLSNIPIVLYSTSMMPADEESVMQMGAHSFFTKPHSQDKLVASLIQVFGN